MSERVCPVFKGIGPPARLAFERITFFRVAQVQCTAILRSGIVVGRAAYVDAVPVRKRFPVLPAAPCGVDAWSDVVLDPP